MEKYVKVTTTRILPTYTILRASSWFYFQLASKEVSNHHKIASMLFSAFCLEAFLNHLGDARIPNWESLKEKYSSKLYINFYIEWLERIERIQKVGKFSDLS